MPVGITMPGKIKTCEQSSCHTTLAGQQKRDKKVDFYLSLTGISSQPNLGIYGGHNLYIYNMTEGQNSCWVPTFGSIAFSFLQSSPLILVKISNVLTCSVEFGFPCIAICCVKINIKNNIIWHLVLLFWLLASVILVILPLEQKYTEKCCVWWSGWGNSFLKFLQGTILLCPYSRVAALVLGMCLMVPVMTLAVPPFENHLRSQPDYRCCSLYYLICHSDIF